MVERFAVNEDVRGSSPLGGAKSPRSQESNHCLAMSNPARGAFSTDFYEFQSLLIYFFLKSDGKNCKQSILKTYRTG